MSITAVQEFLPTVAESETLQAELLIALEAEGKRQAVTNLAQSKQYDFAGEELYSSLFKI